MGTYSYHQNFDETGKMIQNTEEVEDESLYDLMTKKKQKLITEIKNEKVVNPSVLIQADEAIDNLKKKHCSGTVGRLQFYSCFVKGKYYYLHKIINGEMYRNSIRLYSTEVSDEADIKEIQKGDPLCP